MDRDFFFQKYEFVEPELDHISVFTIQIESPEGVVSPVAEAGGLIPSENEDSFTSMTEYIEYGDRNVVIDTFVKKKENQNGDFTWENKIAKTDTLQILEEIICCFCFVSRS